MNFTFILPENYLDNSPKNDLVLPEGANGVVLHCCCAPCSIGQVQCLLVNNIKPLMFFYNPNIYPEDEYIKRRDEWICLCEQLNLEYIIGDYNHQEYLDSVKGLEDEPERGNRCLMCFKHRLLVTAQVAKQRNLNLFATTLCTSRWKSKKQVDAAGLYAQEKTGIKYWDQDWRKEGLVERRYQLVKEIDFYNQQYCGCEFSINKDSYRK